MLACLIKAEAVLSLGRNPQHSGAGLAVLGKRKISCPTPLLELRTVQTAAVITPITARGVPIQLPPYSHPQILHLIVYSQEPGQIDK